MSSTRSRLLKLTGRRYEPVNLPGFGPLRVRSLNDGERAIVEEFAKTRTRELKRVVLVLSLVEPDSDDLVFPFDDETELESFINLLSCVDGAVVDRIVSAAMKLNQFSEADIRSLLGEHVNT
jgi:hypothetical protein